MFRFPKRSLNLTLYFLGLGISVAFQLKLNFIVVGEGRVRGGGFSLLKHFVILIFYVAGKS